MADTYAFKIDGRAFPDMPVISPDISYEILDGEGSGRMEGEGWPMFRDPQGCIINADIVCGLPLNHYQNRDFVDLIEILKDFGSTDFRAVTLATPSGIITQDMYSATFKISGRKVYRDGVMYWGTLPVQFRAREGFKE